MSVSSWMRESKTMNQLPIVNIEFVADESVSSVKRSREATEIIFQMLLLARKRGRPLKVMDMEDLDAA